MSVRLAAATLPALLFATVVVAQESALQDRQERREERRENRREALNNAADRIRNAAPGQTQGLDGLLVQMLAPANMEEIALARLAERQSKNPLVKEFAQQVIQDHTQFLEQLRRFGNVSAGPAAPADNESGGASRARVNVGNATIDAPAAPRQEAAEPDQGAAAREVDVLAGGVEVRTPAEGRPARVAAGGIDSQILPLMHEVHQRCLASTQRYLQNKQGQQFDDAYVGIQIVQHMQMLDKLAVASEHASPQLQQVLQQGTQTAQTHLEHAEKLMQQLARAQRNEGDREQGAAAPSANQ